jgi:hypothetical protein
MQKQKHKQKLKLDAHLRVRTPEPVVGRKNVDLQTDLYLEELPLKIPEAFAATQTDAFMDRAPTPFYIPQKSGVDAMTQIYDGELFNFDIEVQPILEVLVGKTIEQSLMEVLEEEELQDLKRRQAEFEQKRNAEYVEVQRLEAAEKRRTEEKARRLKEQQKLKEQQVLVAEKVAARNFAQQFLDTLLPSIYEQLTTHGFFYDKVEREVEDDVLPWLTSELDKKFQREALSIQLVDGKTFNIHIQTLF